MRSISSDGREVLDIWLLATVPGRDPVSLHGEYVIVGHNVAEAFDRMIPDLVSSLRREVIGDD